MEGMVKLVVTSVIGAVFSLVSFIPTFLTGLWANYDSVEGISIYFSPLGFSGAWGGIWGTGVWPVSGTINGIFWGIQWSGDPLYYVGGIMLVAAGLLLLIGTRNPKAALIGGILAAAGPIVWLLIMVSPPLPGAGYELAGDISTAFYNTFGTEIMFLSGGFYLPIIGGLLGSSKGLAMLKSTADATHTMST